MEKVRLQFQNTEELVRFQKVISCCAYRIDMTNLILTCHCNKEDILKAVEEFGAKIIVLPFSIL